VFLVDDSPLALVMLKRMIATSSDLEVVGTARSGREALEQFERAQPEVICTDYLMPDMDGLALIQRTMEVFPRPILVISSTIDPAERQRAFPLLTAGAVDVVAKRVATSHSSNRRRTGCKKSNW
jgi:two-component system chemotaxis response regulator CheB